MMQFSLSPARVLDDAHLDATLAAVTLHQHLCRRSTRSPKQPPEPANPSCGPSPTTTPATSEIVDQFLLGENILAAPVLDPNAAIRRVVLPAGTWWIRTSNDTMVRQV